MTAKLTQKQYAARRKVTPQYVNKLVHQGKIARDKHGLIDPKKADRALKLAQQRPWRSGLGKTAKVSRTRRNAAGHSAASTAAKSSPAQESATRSLTQARAVRENYLARQAKIDYEKAVGTLLLAADVLEAERRKNAQIRARFRRIPRMMAPRLDRAKSPAEIEELLLAEIDAQLSELAADPLGASAAPAITSAEMPLTNGAIA